MENEYTYQKILALFVPQRYVFDATILQEIVHADTLKYLLKVAINLKLPDNICIIQEKIIQFQKNWILTAITMFEASNIGVALPDRGVLVDLSVMLGAIDPFTRIRELITNEGVRNSVICHIDDSVGKIWNSMELYRLMKFVYRKMCGQRKTDDLRLAYYAFNNNRNEETKNALLAHITNLEHIVSL